MYAIALIIRKYITIYQLQKKNTIHVHYSEIISKTNYIISNIESCQNSNSLKTI